MMTDAVFVLAGFLVGFAVGRWWSLTAAVAFGVVVASISEVEAPPEALGVAYGVIAAAGICGGVMTRRALRRRRAS